MTHVSANSQESAGTAIASACMRSIQRCGLILGIAAVVLAGPTTALAQTTTWTTTSGTVFITGSNWSSGTSPNASTATAVFAGTTASGTSNLASTVISLNQLIIRSGARAYRISDSSSGAGAVNFSAGGGLTVEAGVTTNQIFDPLARGTSGTSTFTNNGSGTLTFGPTSWFNELGGQTWTPAFDGSGDITVTNGIRNRNSSSNISVIKNGSGTLTILSGVNTAPTSTGLGWYTGSTTINAGVLQLGNQWALGGGSGDIRFGGGTLRYSGSNTVDYSARIKSSSAAISIDTAGQTVTFGTSLPSTNTGGLTKLGAGTLTLSASNAYTGATSVNAGTLAFDRVSALNSSSGVNVAAGAILDYTGGAGTLSRNVTVSSSGTGTIRNSGGQALTLSGTLTKDGRVLRLTGGTFNVTGQIVGASANSDLLVDGTSTVTLSSANTYNGPTFVNQASTLIVGVNNAIPSSSTVTLGNATSTGSLDIGTFSNQIGGLVFSGSGGTVRMAANQTASPQLSTSSALTLGSKIGRAHV